MEVEEKILGVTVMATVCSFGVFFNLWAILIIRRNNKVSLTVRIYFLADHIQRIIICNITIFFTSPCAFTYFCNETEIGWFFNRILGYVKIALIVSTHCFTLALTLNRFFAVFDSGRYYNRVSKHIMIQSIVLTLIPFVLLSPLLIQDEDNVFEPDYLGWWNHGELSHFIILIVWYNGCITIWVVVICVDTATAVIFRRKIVNSGSSAMKRMDKQIMKQVITFHSVCLSYFLTMRVFNTLRVWENWGYLDELWFYDFLPAVVDLFSGVSRVFFLIPKKAKASKSETTMSSTQNQTPRFTTRTAITRVE